MITDRYCVYKASFRCDECGTFIPLDGPVLAVTCSGCSTEISLPARGWKGLVEDAINGYSTLVPGALKKGTLSSSSLGTIQRAWGRCDPQCHACSAALAVNDIAAGFEGAVSCNRCGAITAAFPAPDWLRAELPVLLQLFRVPANGARAPYREMPTAVRKRTPWYLRFRGA